MNIVYKPTTPLSSGNRWHPESPRAIQPGYVLARSSVIGYDSMQYADCHSRISLRKQSMDIHVKIYRALIWLSLYAVAVHFADNVYFFDQ